MAATRQWYGPVCVGHFIHTAVLSFPNCASLATLCFSLLMWIDEQNQQTDKTRPTDAATWPLLLWTITDIISKTVQHRGTYRYNGKMNHVCNPMLPTTMTSNNREGHFRCVRPF